jgi:hypothetical protein
MRSSVGLMIALSSFRSRPATLISWPLLPSQVLIKVVTFDRALQAHGGADVLVLIDIEAFSGFPLREIELGSGSMPTYISV